MWWGWNPEKVENWLEEMEMKGWNLYKVGVLGLRFIFKKGKSARVRYCADYQSSLVGDQYFNIFKDDGWELAWEGTGWYIWKKLYAEERPSIYTDISSLIERNNRVAIVLLPIFFFLIPLFITAILPSRGDNLFSFLFFCFYITVFALYGAIFYNIRKVNRKLKKNNIRE